MLERIFTFLSVYYSRRKLWSFVKKMEKLPRLVQNAGLPPQHKLQLQRSLKLAFLQIFNPKYKGKKFVIPKF